MASTKTSELEVREQLKDITECCVCSETYRDPKILPCIHTFCMKCLEEAGGKTSKSPGDQMPCPMCRKEFTIPEEGYAALQRNFFMEKLIEMAEMAGSSEGPDLCEACMEEERESSSASEVPLADMYCNDCEQKLCQECCRHHRKYKLTRSHWVIAAAEFQGKARIVPPCFCKKHKRELDLYCSDCKDLVCKSCFGESHQNHRLQDVRNVVEGFKNEIKESLSGLEECESEVLEKKEDLNSKVEKYCENLENLKLDVLEQKVEVVRLVSEHANLVLQDIDQLKAQKRKEVEAEIEDSDRYLTCLESFRDYCAEVMTKGSASDICSAVNKLKARAKEIKEQHEFEIKVRSSLPEMYFQMSDLEEFVKTEDYNIVGTIQECQTEAEDEDETDNISHDGNTDMEDDLSMPVPCNNGILAKINQLKQELENERRRICGLEKEKEAFEKRISELETKLGLKMPSQSIVSSATPVASNPPRISVYNRPPYLVKTLQSLEGSQSRETDNIFGIAVLDDELFLGCFVVHSVVEVYDIKTFHFKRRWYTETMLASEILWPTVKTQPGIMISGTRRFRGLVSCTRHKYLYSCVSFPSDLFGRQLIQRTDVNGSNAKEWKINVGTCISNFSVTGEGNIIVINDKGSFIEYSRDGELVHEVKLPWSLGIEHPLHVLKLVNGSFVVSHGLGKDHLQRVLILSESGQIIKSIQEITVSYLLFPEGTSPHAYQNIPVCLNEPVCLAVDIIGSILVADRGNNRIVVLNSNLEPESFIYPYQPLQKPNYMCVETVDANRRRLYVCEDFKKISVYDFSVLVFFNSEF